MFATSILSKLSLALASQFFQKKITIIAKKKKKKQSKGFRERGRVSKGSAQTKEVGAAHNPVWDKGLRITFVGTSANSKRLPDDNGLGFVVAASIPRIAA